jgi:cation diffusion facilitator CzcD-associated flavoprotein CzcO
VSPANLSATPSVDVAIVGTGFSGLAMAIQLKKAGKASFVVLEKASAVGGTWRENRYPGCACDVPSHLYSYSFEPNPRWSRMFAPQEEILAYLEHCAEKYGIVPHIRFQAEVIEAEFDEQRSFWRVRLRSGEPLTARHLVLGIGALHRPSIPRIDGAERFLGEAFHSAQWDPRAKLAGKRVGIVGTGASAIQLVPRLAPQVEQLHVFQRTPPWVMPKPDRPMAALEQRLFEAVPTIQRLYRYAIYWTMEARGLGFTVTPKAMHLVGMLGRRYIRQQLRDPRLRAAVTPTHTPGCKRILLANDYYPALERPNVELVTQPIAKLTERAIVTRDGVARPIDMLVYGTGFRVTELLTHLKIRGRGGVDINDAWRDRIEAYLGTTVSGFPNLILLMGPNTGLGHNSMVFMIEAQVRYALACMRMMAEHGVPAADVRPATQRAFNARLLPRLRRSVWASGCQSWYLDEKGNNATVWPGFTFEFWLRTLRVDPSDYELDPRPGTEAPGQASGEAPARPS